MVFGWFLDGFCMVFSPGRERRAAPKPEWFFYGFFVLGLARTLFFIVFSLADGLPGYGFWMVFKQWFFDGFDFSASP